MLDSGCFCFVNGLFFMVGFVVRVYLMDYIIFIRVFFVGVFGFDLVVEFMLCFIS